jgi:hypothetical protein
MPAPQARLADESDRVPFRGELRPPRFTSAARATLVI